MEVVQKQENIKMNADTPVIKRCCFCLPLRYTLRAWSYFKLVVAAIFITIVSYTLLHTLLLLDLYKNENRSRIYAEVVISIITLFLFVTDFLFTIVFVGRGPKKNVKVMRVFYFFSIVMWILTILLTAVAVSLLIYSSVTHDITVRSSVISFLIFLAYFMTITIQTYFLIVLKDAIFKLSNNCEIELVKNTRNEYILNSEGEVSGDETDTEDA